MARDETARERDPEQALLERPTHLRLAGAAAATVAGATTTGDTVTREGDDGGE